MLSLVICVLLSYLIGSIPSSIIVSKLVRGIDIREYGSGNAGFANVARVLGWKPASIVLIFDLLKGFAVTYWLASYFVPAVPLGPEATRMAAGTAAVTGHIWTIFASFRGGKGVLTALGMFLALLPIPTIACAFVAGAVMYVFGYVSLGSMMGGICLPVMAGTQKYIYGSPIPDVLFAFSILIALLILFTHRSNIGRLLNGTERKIGKTGTEATP